MARSSAASTVRLKPRIAKAAKKVAESMGKSLSDLTNEGLAAFLARRALALRLAKERPRSGKTRNYEAFVAELRRDGEL